LPRHPPTPDIRTSNAPPSHLKTLQGGGTQVRWCIPEAANAALVASCTAAVAGANTQGVTFSCVAGGSEEACLEAIRNRTADLLTLGGEGI